MSLWTDGRTREHEPPRQGSDPPASPPRSAAPGGSDPSRGAGAGSDPSRGGGSRWLAALGGGTVSAVVVSAVLLGTGLAGDDSGQPAAATATPAPVVTNANDGKGDLVRSVYAAASPSVVSVRTPSGSGTGFLVDG